MKLRDVLGLSALLMACEPDVEGDLFPPRGIDTDPGSYHECTEGAFDQEPCTYGLGSRERECVDGYWTTWTECDDYECLPGEEEIEDCGDGSGNTRTRACQFDRIWSEWSDCPAECDEYDERSDPCGLNGRGTQSFTCVDAQWVADDECDDPDECVDDTWESAGCETELGAGTRDRQCFEGAWLDGECNVPVPPLCSDGETNIVSCGLNDRGVRSDVCWYEEWSEGTCEDPDQCVDGSVHTQACGSGGTQNVACLEGRFQPPGVCSQICGNGTVEGGEQCDNTLEAEPNGCSASCMREPVRVLHAAPHCAQAPAMLAAAWSGAVHWLSNCEQASLFTRSAAGTFTSSDWDYSGDPGNLSLSMSINGVTPILWGRHAPGIPWSLVGEGDAFAFVLELDEHHEVLNRYPFSSNARDILALESLGTGRFSLVGSMGSAGTVRYGDVALSTPQSTLTPQASLFVIEQKPGSAAGFAINSSRPIESSHFSAWAERNVLLLRNAGGAFELSSGVVQASQVLIVSNDQGRFVATPSLTSGKQSTALLRSGNPVVTGMGGGSYDVQGMVVSLPSGPVTLVYNNRAQLIAAHPGRFVAETDQGTLAVLGDFTGAELTLDRGMLSERTLSSPYGQYNRYLAFYRLSGAVADARVVASSANQGDLTIHLEPRAFARGFVLSIPCASATRFGDEAGNAVAGAGLCMARFDAAAQLMWSQAVTVHPDSQLLVGVDRDYTWLAGAVTALAGRSRPAQIAVLGLGSFGTLLSDEPIVALGAGRLSGMVANGGRAFVVATFQGTPEVFPGRPWRTTEWTSDSDYVIQVQL